MDDYRLIADRLAADIAAGRLRAGDRLPPQRRFARQHGIAASTAARVYGELVRRGLAVGEVGRGTFVRAARPPAEPALAEPTTARIDLELNFPVLPDQPALLARSLAGLLTPEVLAEALPPVGVAGTAAARQAAAALLARADWTPDADRVLFAGNGRQAIAGTVAALVPVGERLGVEALTYPVVKAVAARLGVELVPLAVDEHGLVPDAVRAAHRSGPLRAVYLQPSLHNPLGTTMPAQRRAEVADTLRELDLPAVEDGIYAFLRAELPPLAALAPEHVVVVDSLSKRLAPGLTLGFAVPPAHLHARVAAALRSGTWIAGHFALAAATRWMSDGTAAAIQQAKRADAAARQHLARTRLAGFTLRADPAAYHCWWELPEPWRAETFVAAAARRGIAVTPAAAFTVGPAHAPNAVRLALAAPPVPVLTDALDALAALARSAPEDTGVE
ncbi:aminotransferase-like domain-containing protein [Goodfellowiella coeruleoviolacea]|uniref:DNA-binding transcriptional regulator, MocR family, contains an aminotransferase domain n=1 Tax=Goodfellowiella coeruleoviolacea TaxID=334858 RepID=A0AAE3GG97_9PSEU|nr:PLP-dependent aminotransferase family protein [Goodfellowiella coeruleoviolacea]MCP2166842.1 DNA-binding transcriptional regulator, MocR family, contains an aminotransferase domain [Goodfellowiella coeruleoviolacea]